MAEGWPKERRILGTKVKRLDGPDKATGRAKYSYDINRPGLLHGLILRCPHAHARIKSLDISPAEKMPGVKAAVLVGDAKPGKELYFPGEEIAAVAADTEEHARDALRAIKVEYEVLEHVVSEEDVLKNPDKKTTPGKREGNFQPGSAALRGKPGEDDLEQALEKAFAEADAVSEGTYGVPVISHQCLESHGLVAEWTGDDELTVWASTQAVVRVAQQLAQRFRIPQTKVKCITHYMGGGFGSKFGPEVEGYTAAELARKAKAPVKIMLDREEEVTTAGNRPSAYGTVKIGGTRDGRITAFAVDCYGTPGYTGGATVNLGLLPYIYQDAIPNWKRAHSIVYINAGPARAMRAPGHPQNCVLTEFAVDDLAAKLGIDPLVIRRKCLPPNDPAVKAKDPIAWLGRRNDIYNEQLEIAVKLSGWKEKWHPPGKGPGRVVKHGIGMALHTWGGAAAGGQPNECTVIIGRDGSVTAETSTQDLGTGQRTVTAIVVAEILGLEPTSVITKIGESQLGFSSGSGGSTTCPSQAPAALLAAQAARDELFKMVAPRVGADPKDLKIEPGKVIGKDGQSWNWKEFCARLGMDEVRATGQWSQPISQQPGNENISSAQVGGVQTAEVLVDTETGVVRITHIVAVQDCGLVVNKLACESQVAGGVIMGLNYALFEEIIRDRVTGRQVNPDMEFYKLGGLRDMPKITVYMQDMPERGVIGIGEPPTVSTAAAVGNAVFNALGVRVPFLPLTPKRVLDALAKGGKV
jgi:xanthine dehydrogenase YagR molybdenum-binding subunit